MVNAHEQRSWRMLTDCRLYLGVPPPAWSPALYDNCHRWAGQLTATGRLAHSDMAALLASQPRTWRRVGENVGVGGNADVVFDAWVHSPAHFKNLTERVFTHAAVAAVEAHGSVWFVQQFAHIR